jgi:hypothetical protein
MSLTKKYSTMAYPESGDIEVGRNADSFGSQTVNNGGSDITYREYIQNSVSCWMTAFRKMANKRSDERKHFMQSKPYFC